MERMTTGMRREQIIDTAMHIISEEGFSSFTTRKLAGKIGVSEPALYRHFNNKDEILIGIIRRMDDLWDEINKLTADTDSFPNKLYWFMKMHFNFIEKNHDIVAILFADEYIRRNEIVNSVLEEVQVKRFIHLTQLLKKSMNTGEFKRFDPEITAVIILGTIRSAIMNWRNCSVPYSLSEHGEEVIKTILGMLKSD